MSNIIKIIQKDFRKIKTNVIALVIIMGLTVLPALYAWFNILSNWDPYGEDATSQMQIAVVSNDEGIQIGDLHYVVGDTVIEKLEANRTIDWQFPESEDEAMESVRNGTYYAALIIPESFSADLVSFANGDLIHPTIQYYDNNKKNAIATKITSKVKSTIKNEINTAFAGTLAKAIAAVGNVAGNEDVHNKLYSGTMEKLSDVDSDLDRSIQTIHSFAALTDSAEGLIDSTRMLIPDVENMGETGTATIKGLQSSVEAGGDSVSAAGQIVDLQLDNVIAQLSALSSQIDSLDTATDLSGILEQYDTSITITGKLFKALDAILSATDPDYAEAKASFEELQTKIKELAGDVDAVSGSISAKKDGIKKEIDDCTSHLKVVKNTFDNETLPDIQSGVNNIDSTLTEAAQMLADIDADFADVDKQLLAYRKTLSDGADSLAETEKTLVDIQGQVQNAMNTLELLNSGDLYETIMSLAGRDPSKIADFIQSPVTLDTETFYEIDNYGSAMAPFYTTLALWVGALILSAIIHANVKKKDELESLEIKSWQAYIGRYVLFFIIAELQALLTALGDLFYIGIQCAHPVRFVLGCLFIGFVFSFLIYSLTYALGNVGQAIAVIILVIQVAGAGGTFPIEVLPLPYRMTCKFLPFTYCLNMLRGCVGGLYQHEFVVNMGILMIFSVISLLIGLLLPKPFSRLNRMIEKSKEKSGVMM